jgi:hypothetical protein
VLRRKKKKGEREPSSPCRRRRRLAPALARAIEREPFFGGEVD